MKTFIIRYYHGDTKGVMPFDAMTKIDAIRGFVKLFGHTNKPFVAWCAGELKMGYND